jgi:hypothetical protein
MKTPSKTEFEAAKTARIIGNFEFSAMPMNNVATLEFVNELLT